MTKEENSYSLGCLKVNASKHAETDSEIPKSDPPGTHTTSLDLQTFAGAVIDIGEAYSFDPSDLCIDPAVDNFEVADIEFNAQHVLRSSCACNNHGTKDMDDQDFKCLHVTVVISSTHRS